MPTIKGVISITGLPPNHGLIVSLCYFWVITEKSPPPYNGDPPEHAVRDCEHPIFKDVNLNSESRETSFNCAFTLDRPVGYYYVQLRVILFRSGGGRVVAQNENFFFRKRPMQVLPVTDGVFTLPVSWPTVAFEDLHIYRKLTPQKRTPQKSNAWWKFW